DVDADDGRARARPGLADRSRDVLAAAAVAVAGAVQPAARFVGRGADRGRARGAALGDQGADARRSLDVAGPAGSGAGRVAADAVDAEAALTLAIAAAGLTVHVIRGRGGAASAGRVGRGIEV